LFCPQNRSVEEFNKSHVENAHNVPYVFITEAGKVMAACLLIQVSSALRGSHKVSKIWDYLVKYLTPSKPTFCMISLSKQFLSDTCFILQMNRTGEKSRFCWPGGSNMQEWGSFDCGEKSLAFNSLKQQQI